MALPTRNSKRNEEGGDSLPDLSDLSLPVLDASPSRSASDDYLADLEVLPAPELDEINKLPELDSQESKSFSSAFSAGIEDLNSSQSLEVDEEHSDLLDSLLEGSDLAPSEDSANINNSTIAPEADNGTDWDAIDSLLNEAEESTQEASISTNDLNDDWGFTDGIDIPDAPNDEALSIDLNDYELEEESSEISEDSEINEEVSEEELEGLDSFGSYSEEELDSLPIDEEPEELEEEEGEAFEKPKPRSKKKKGQKKQPFFKRAPLALIGFLSKLPLVGKFFAKLTKYALAVFIVFILLPLFILPLIFQAIAGAGISVNSQINFPDGGKAIIEEASFVNDPISVTATVQNTGNVIADLEAEFNVYSYQPNLINPLTWFSYETIGKCTTEPFTVDIEESLEVKASCDFDTVAGNSPKVTSKLVY